MRDAGEAGRAGDAGPTGGAGNTGPAGGADGAGPADKSAGAGDAGPTAAAQAADRLETRQLADFVEAARAGSMSRAAAARGVSQQALSKSVARLEETLGAELFARSRSGVELTDFGAYLLPRAKRILAAVGAAERGLGEFLASRRRPVVLGMTPACSQDMGGRISPAMLRDLQESLQESCPGAAFECVELPSREVVGGLYDRSLDFGLGATVDRERFERRALARFELGAVAAPGSPAAAAGRVRPADLASYEVAVPPGDDELARALKELCDKAGVSARVSPLRLESPDPSELVVDARTLAVRPLEAARQSIRRPGYAAVPLLDADGRPVRATLWLAWRRTLTLGPAERALLGFLANVYGGNGAAAAQG